MKQDMKGARIFFSYARSDGEAVGEIYEILKAEGLDPWMDVKNLLPGEKWMQAIRRALSRADFFLFFLSPRSSGRRGVLQKEIRQALEIAEGHLDEDIFLIPFQLADCEIPERIAHYQIIRAGDPDWRTKLLDAFASGIRRKQEPGAT